MRIMLKIALFLVIILSLNSAWAQYYDSTEIASINADRTAAEGDLYLDTTKKQYYLGLTTGEVIRLASDRNWLLNGNDSVSTSQFLGTLNDAILAFKSNNITGFSVGRRITQNLYDNSNTGLFPYNDSNALVAYVQGVNGVSALEFEADSAAFYKPVFYTDLDGNFKMRGSSANTDFLELGSAGTVDNAGRSEFVIGEDGEEPILFEKYNYTTQEYIEIVRMQGVGSESTVRVGIATKGQVPSSTLEVNGSFATAVSQISSLDSLEEIDHTVILSSNSALKLPPANTTVGGTGNDNNTGIENSFGYMTGFAQNYNGTIAQQVICGGGSGNSINDISRYAANNRCVGVRYGNQNGVKLGLTTASITSFDDDGFTLNVNNNDDARVVIYTAYR